MANCEDCGRYILLKVKTTTLCKSCFFKRRAKADSANQRLKRQLIKERGGKCEVCGDTKKLQAHHIVHVSKGGKNELSNLKLVCHDCHLNKEHGGSWR